MCLKYLQIYTVIMLTFKILPIVAYETVYTISHMTHNAKSELTKNIDVNLFFLCV